MNSLLTHIVICCYVSHPARVQCSQHLFIIFTWNFPNTCTCTCTVPTKSFQFPNEIFSFFSRGMFGVRDITLNPHGTCLHRKWEVKIDIGNHQLCTIQLRDLEKPHSGFQNKGPITNYCGILRKNNFN